MLKTAAVLLSAASAFVTAFIAYCHMRGQIGGVGLAPGVSLLAGLCASVAVFMVCIIITPALLAPFIAIDRRRAARSMTDRCWRCDYDLRTLAQCPECGESRTASPPLALPVKTILLLYATLVLCAITAMAAGEAYMCWEEASFRSEASAACARTGAASYSRRRWWPSGSSALVYEASTGNVINTG